MDDRILGRQTAIVKRAQYPRRQSLRLCCSTRIVLQLRHCVERNPQSWQSGHLVIPPGLLSVPMKNHDAIYSTAFLQTSQAAQMIANHLRHAAAVQMVVDDS